MKKRRLNKKIVRIFRTAEHVVLTAALIACTAVVLLGMVGIDVWM